MIYNIAAKGFKLSHGKLDYIDRHVKKVSKFLSDIDINLLQFDIVLRKYKGKRLDQGSKILPINSESIKIKVYPKFKSPIYYESRIWLQIPIRSLVARSKGASIEEAINISFDRLLKELETYEGKHIPSDSDYYDRTKI